ncbi:MAG: FAD-binding oxidoreductase [Myxococcota bacterium]
MTLQTQSIGDLPSSADTVIIGAGIMGLAVAFHLAERAPKRRIVVVDKGYLCGGASGRNGGGVRAQWSSAINIELMRESLELCADFAQRMGINVWFRRGGYLFLARSETYLKQLGASAELQRSFGLKTRVIEAKEARRIVPELSADSLLGASWNPDDAVVFPWPFVWGYAKGAADRGVHISPFTEVLGFERQGDAISAVLTSAGSVRTAEVVLAAGAWSPEIAKALDLHLPNWPHRHEICSTEPLKPFLGPLVADLESGLYCSQSMRGEIVGGISNERVPEGLDQRSSLRFLALYARAMTQTFPVLGGIRILRQWAGCYDLTPDGSPIVGRVDAVPGLILLCGFMGHGFMMAPIMGKRVAAYLTTGEGAELFDRWSLGRFERGELIQESMILG